MTRLAGAALVLAGCGRLGFQAHDAAPRDAIGSDAVDALPACGFLLGTGRQHLTAVLPDGSGRVLGRRRVRSDRRRHDDGSRDADADISRGASPRPAAAVTRPALAGPDLLVPTQVEDSNAAPVVSAVDIGLGIEHGCALLEDRSVWCWGRNQYGQLGNGMT